MRFITDQGMRKIAQAAVDTGNWVCEDGRKHHKLRHKSGACIPFAKSTSDSQRAIKNVERDIRHVEAGTHKFCFK